MTLGELRRQLEGMPDDAEVVIFDQVHPGCWTSPSDAHLFDVVYVGDNRLKHALPGVTGEPERVLIIQ